MTQEQAKQLLDNYLAGRCTPHEKALVEAWYNHRLSRQPADETQHDWQSLERYLAEQLPLTDRSPRQKKQAYIAAAAAILIIALGWIYWINTDTQRADLRFATDLPPGDYKADLQLSDGRKLSLTEHEEIIVGETGITYADGEVIAAPLHQRHQHSAMMILSTPVGGQYRVVLPDGSRVWLNSASTLKYPSVFSDVERVVVLEGEAYFDVSKQTENGLGTRNVPFRVVSKGQLVEVLGTQFNISAYPDDKEIKTTLVAGSVQVESTVGRQSPTTIRPGQQTIVSGAQTTVRDVDVSPYTAWKDGFFIFDDESLGSILTQLRRWYGFTEVQLALPDLHFTGGVRRDVPLSKVLEMLEVTTNDVHFELNGKEVVVKPGKRN